MKLIFWRRKKAYQRLGRRTRRFWRIKNVRKLKLRFFSPKKLLVRIRDAYVNMMLKLANSGVMIGTGGECGFGSRPLKEYDEKVILEMYKSIIMAQKRQNHTVSTDAGRISSEVLT